MREITILVRFLVVFCHKQQVCWHRRVYCFFFDWNCFVSFIQIQHTGKIFFGKREEMRLTSTLQSFALLQLLACQYVCEYSLNTNCSLKWLQIFILMWFAISSILNKETAAVLWDFCLYTACTHRFFSLNFVNDGQSVKFINQMQTITKPLWFPHYYKNIILNY